MTDKISEIAERQYYQQPGMIKFLLAENLALKMLLHDKGLLDPKAFETYKKQAADTLQLKTDSFVETWKKDHPDVVQKLEGVIHPICPPVVS